MGEFLSATEELLASSTLHEIFPGLGVADDHIRATIPLNADLGLDSTEIPAI
ncbi:hypothetical protein AB0L88_15435 [Saccharopolyspora shandongensis]|uniref:hypothetical protein n=1 Tax=Saccharopolyspora shandongensis TaxID=418495 RepID=UPI00341317B4